jgi:2-keto-4-pentenoate hydratase/2-oxohepta-3-ene-1,7-dioic acid hydratase in catechol pathway
MIAEGKMIELPVIGGGSYRLAPSKIIAVGLNYREHVAESPSILADAAKGGAAPSSPEEPVLFPKTPNVLVGTGEPIVLPLSFLAERGIAPGRTDFEAELAFIVGRRCRNVSPGEARSFILGYTCFNDVSQRELQNGIRSGWYMGKSFDGFGPVGPAILPESPGLDPQALRIVGRLNGKVLQDSSTSHMIFSVAQIISYISRYVTLEAGDLVATGTPSGVAPLSPGDVVEVEIEGIGVLRNPVVAG